MGHVEHIKIPRSLSQQPPIERATKKLNQVIDNGDYKKIFYDYPDFPYCMNLTLKDAEKMIDDYYAKKSSELEEHYNFAKQYAFGHFPENYYDDELLKIIANVTQAADEGLRIFTHLWNKRLVEQEIEN